MEHINPHLTYIKEAADLNQVKSTPLYKRIQQVIGSAIRQGVIKNNDALPSERELAQALNVSRVTIRKAIESLAQEGLVSQKRGAGTFVSFRAEQPLSKLTGFTEDIISRGLIPGITWIDRSCGTATPEESLVLKLSPGSPVSRLYRIRFADKKPMCLEHTTLPRDVLPNPEGLNTSLYLELEKSNMRPTRALQRLRAQLIEPGHAELLQVQPATACLYIERCSFLPDGREIEFVRSYYRGDSYDFIAELQL